MKRSAEPARGHPHKSFFPEHFRLPRVPAKDAGSSPSAFGWELKMPSPQGTPNCLAKAVKRGLAVTIAAWSRSASSALPRQTTTVERPRDDETKRNTGQPTIISVFTCDIQRYRSGGIEKVRPVMTSSRAASRAGAPRRSFPMAPARFPLTHRPGSAKASVTRPLSCHCPMRGWYRA